MDCIGTRLITSYVKKRWSSAILSAKTLPGADCGYDHQLLVCKIKLRLKKKSKTKRPIRLNMQEITDNYTIEMKK